MTASELAYQISTDSGLGLCLALLGLAISIQVGVVFLRLFLKRSLSDADKRVSRLIQIANSGDEFTIKNDPSVLIEIQKLGEKTLRLRKNVDRLSRLRLSHPDVSSAVVDLQKKVANLLQKMNGGHS